LWFLIAHEVDHLLASVAYSLTNLGVLTLLEKMSTQSLITKSKKYEYLLINLFTHSYCNWRKPV